MATRVLIVDEDGPLRQNLTLRLRLEKFKVLACEGPEELKWLLNRRKIDVILLGLNGLKERGLYCLETIKEIRPLAEVILINDPDNLALSIAGMKLGAFDDLLMPLELHTLLDKIREACDRKRQKAAKKGKKQTLVRRCQDLMVAVSFAEAGELDTARDLLGREEEK